MSGPSYEFYSKLARILNSGQARSVILSGSIYDLFWNGEAYVPLIPFLCDKCQRSSLRVLVYELNGPIRMSQGDREAIRRAWIEWRSGEDMDSLILEDFKRKRSEADFLGDQFDGHLRNAIGNGTAALEFLRQLTICSRERLNEGMLIIVEAADMLLPDGGGDLSRLNDRQMRRISIVQDWFGDPAFVNGADSVCLIAESRSLIHARISRMPQVLCVEAPSPNADQRQHYIEHFLQQSQGEKADLAEAPLVWSDPKSLADFTAGLSLHALRQMLAGAAYQKEEIQPSDVVAKVEEYIQAQLGDDVVEFKKPSHTLEDVIGFERLKGFLREELIPRFRAKGDKALPGAAVAGPIGSGKTFIFEAVAAELDIPVLVLKSIRSQWFGQTDVIFERLRRVLEALEKVVIFVDEADTQFGGVGESAHATERRLTGKVQAMMSDSTLRGRVLWLLMTARIHLLSPDIRRPGRVGDLIIPVLDPQRDDRRAFVRWVLQAGGFDDAELAARLDEEALPNDYSAAAFASLRSQVKALAPKSEQELAEMIYDHLPPAIGATRKYQTLQALVNCTRRSLLPDPKVSDEQRQQWETAIRELERQGVR